MVQQEGEEVGDESEEEKWSDEELDEEDDYGMQQLAVMVDFSDED